MHSAILGALGCGGIAPSDACLGHQLAAKLRRASNRWDGFPRVAHPSEVGVAERSSGAQRLLQGYNRWVSEDDPPISILSPSHPLLRHLEMAQPS